MPKSHPIQPTRDAVCLAAYLDGWTVKQLAEAIGVSVRTVYRWIVRAKNNPAPPDLELWISGVGKACIHGKPIVRGMPVLCLDCLETGLPDHPALRQGDPVGGYATSEYQPDGPAKFRPKGLEKPPSGLP